MRKSPGYHSRKKTPLKAIGANSLINGIKLPFAQGLRQHLRRRLDSLKDNLLARTFKYLAKTHRLILDQRINKQCPNRLFGCFSAAWRRQPCNRQLYVRLYYFLQAEVHFGSYFHGLRGKFVNKLLWYTK